MILKDALVSFVPTLDHVDTLQQWRNGTYVPLENEPINVYQAFNVVKLVYMSSKYDSAQRLAIYNDQAAKTPGDTAVLAKNTVDALDISDIN